MDPELASILQNIKSLADQATSMSAGGAEKAEPQTEQPGAAQADLPPEIAEKVLKYLKEMDKNPEDDVEKSDDANEDDVEKSAEGPTGDSSAEERIDETTDVNEKNINEVAKSIARMLAGKPAPKKTVAKSAVDKEVLTVLKAITDELKVQKEFSVNILKGLGIADSILKSEEKPKRPAMDVSASEVAKSIEFIRQAIGAPKEENTVSSVGGADHTIAKSLTADNGALLSSMFPKSRR